jgi:hypothetical protein
MALPALSFCTRPALGCCVIQSIPLLQELLNVQSSDRLELQDILLGEYMRHDFPLTSMVGTVSGVEQSSMNGYKGVIKFGLERAISVGVNNLQSGWVCDGYMIRRQAHKGSYEVTGT